MSSKISAFDKRNVIQPPVTASPISNPRTASPSAPSLHSRESGNRPEKHVSALRHPTLCSYSPACLFTLSFCKSAILSALIIISTDKRLAQPTSPNLEHSFDERGPMPDLHAATTHLLIRPNPTPLPLPTYTSFRKTLSNRMTRNQYRIKERKQITLKPFPLSLILRILRCPSCPPLARLRAS